MSHQTEISDVRIEEAERQAFQLSTSQDGLYDIFIGSYIILLSTLPWLDENSLGFPWNIVLVMGVGFLIFFGILLIKKFVVSPRIGQVRFGKKRRQRSKRLTFGMIIIFLLTVGLFDMTVSAIYFREPLLNDPLSWSFPIDIVHTAAGVFIFGIFCLIGYMNNYERLYFYGFLFGLGYIVSTTLQDITGNPFYWPWALSGIVVAVTGITIFIRFLRKYPFPKNGTLK